MKIVDIFYNHVLLITILSWLISQIIKVIYYSVKAGGFKKEFLTSSGGFPSSHTAMATALVVTTIREFGFGSGEFAMTFFFAGIVIYDTLGVRTECGKHARILNNILIQHKELFSSNEGDQEGTLQESIGHTLLEVIAGFIIGAVIGLIIPFW